MRVPETVDRDPFAKATEGMATGPLPVMSAPRPAFQSELSPSGDSCASCHGFYPKPFGAVPHVLPCVGCRSKAPQPGQLSNSLYCPGPGGGGWGSGRGQGRLLPRPPCLASTRHLLPASLHAGPSACVTVASSLVTMSPVLLVRGHPDDLILT